MIYDQKTGKQTDYGVSEYKPKDGSVTVFKYQKDKGRKLKRSLRA